MFLDADTIVTQSIEDLFECQKFCANLKHSERLNSGVMVVEPSTELFEDMLSKVGTLPSYTGGTHPVGKIIPPIKSVTLFAKLITGIATA